MRDAGAGLAEARDLGVVEVHAVREPDVVAEPAELARGTRPAARRSARGRTPPRRSVSARCVCSRTPRARASSAVSRISSRVTENGEQGASAIRSIEPGDGSWNASIAASRTRRGSRRGPRRPRRAAARRCAAPEVHRAAARVEAHAELARRLDLDGQQVARRRAGRRSGGRSPSCSPSAASAASPARAAARSISASIVRPDRVQLDEPLEQRRVLREPARGPLVEVVVAVDEARRGEAAARRRCASRLDVRGGGPSPTSTMRSPSTTMWPWRARAPAVDGRDRAALDDHARDRRHPHRVEDLLVARAAAQVARRAPRGSRRPLGAALRASRSCVATISPGVQNPHCTAPASRNASCTGCSSSSPASPSTVTTVRPSAWPAATRHEHDERAVEVDRARAALALLAGVLGAGKRRAARAARTAAISPSHSPSTSRGFAVDRAGQPHVVLRPGPRQRAPREHAERVRAVRGACRGRRRSAMPPSATSSPKRAATAPTASRRPSQSSSPTANASASRARIGVGAGRADAGADAAVLQRQRERADRDHHRVARADLGELLRAAGRRDQDRRDQLVRGRACFASDR